MAGVVTTSGGEDRADRRPAGSTASTVYEYDVSGIANVSENVVRLPGAEPMGTSSR